MRSRFRIRCARGKRHWIAVSLSTGRPLVGLDVRYLAEPIGGEELVAVSQGDL